MSFDPVTEPIDFVRINGKTSPGVAVIKGASSPRQWDERRAFGMSGAISISRGSKLAHFSAVVSVWTAEQFAALAEWMAPLRALPAGFRGRSARNFSIWHPILEDLGIREVGVEDILQPIERDPGLWEHEIKLIEYRRPKLTLAKTEGSEGDPRAERDPYDVMIEMQDRVLRSSNAEYDALVRELGR